MKSYRADDNDDFSNLIDSKYCCDYCNAQIKPTDFYTYTVSLYCGFKKYHDPCYANLDRWTIIHSLKINSRLYSLMSVFSIVLMLLSVLLNFHAIVLFLIIVFMFIDFYYRMTYPAFVSGVFILLHFYLLQENSIIVIRIAALTIAIISLMIPIYKFKTFEKSIGKEH